MPKIPNPFARPDGKRIYPAKRKGHKAGVDTRPTEREPKRVAPRQRMPKELESMMPPKRGIRPMPKPSRPKPKPRPMPMPKRRVPKALPSYMKPKRKP